MGLRPTADLFCAYLRDALKKELQRGQMKAMKSFVRTCYSEYLIPASSHVADNEREDGSLIPGNEDGTLTTGEKFFLGGLGLKFKFPGDAKKCVTSLVQLLTCRNFSDSPRLREASKTKLWTNYLRCPCTFSQTLDMLTTLTLSARS